MKKVNVGVLTDQFINWGGGVDFIRLILNGLVSINEARHDEISIYVYVPLQNEYKIKLKNAVKVSLDKLFGKTYQLENIITKKMYVESFKSIDAKIYVYYYNGTEADLSKTVVKHNIDFVLPVFTPLSSSFPKPWVGYLYDFQHKYYPEFFSEEEINNRDQQFSLMLNQAKTIIVNAKSVKSDIEKFFGMTRARIITLPFCPALNLDYFETEVDLTIYKLPEKYFMISNQFWKHKDHTTAFKAFKLFLENVPEGTKVGLVCTGQTHDYRFPDYFDELIDLITQLGIVNQVHILGYISKKDQLCIMKNCIAVIQPTMFEGGPGGGAIFESVAYGIPSIVSDIPVNLEIQDESVVFFEKQSPEDLALKMEKIYCEPNTKKSNQYLIKKNKVALLAMGDVLTKIFVDV